MSMRVRHSTTFTGPRQFFWIAIGFEAGILVVAGILGGILLESPPWTSMYWSARDVAYGLAACLPLVAGLLITRRIARGPLGRINELVDRLIVPLFRGCTIAEIVLICVLAGLGEELLFRGVLQEVLTRWMGPIAGLVLAGLLFGAAHLITPTYAALTAVIGIYLGLLWMISGNLLVPVTAHTAYDLAALLYLTHSEADLRD